LRDPMRAARMVAPRRLEIIEIPEPVRAPGQMVVRLTRVTICGSDLHEFRGRTPRNYPWAPGNPAHECLGRIVETEPSFPFREGEAVLVRPEGGGLRDLGVTTLKDLYSIEGTGLAPDVAVMAQLLAPALHACKRLRNVRGKTVFIIGQGPAGLTLTNLIRGMGPGMLVATDLVPERLEESLARGADEAIPGGENLLKKAQEISGNRMFDVVVEAVGDQETINLAPTLAREKGMVLLFGIPDFGTTLTPRSFFGKQLHITTTEYPERSDFLQALRMLSKGDIDMEGMITHRLPFSEVQRAYELADARADGVLRVVLNMEDV